MTNWNIESLRLTVFLRNDPPFDIESCGDWWKQITGTEPDLVSNKPKSASIQVFGTLSNGALLIMDAQPDRVDWQITTSKMSDELDEIPHLGLCDLTEEGFIILMNKWLEAYSPKICRIAFGTILINPVNTKEEGYVTLAKKIPSVQVDPINSSEFDYAINRPRASTIVDTMKINRCSRWNVVALRVLNMPSPTEEGISFIPIDLGSDKLVCRLELDISTSTNVNDLIENPATHFKELTSLAFEIAESGEIA